MLLFRVSRFAARSIRSAFLPLSAAILALCLARPAPAHGAPLTLSITPSPKVVAVGQAFVLDVAVADVSDLFAYQFDVLFDPAILRVDTVVDGGFMTSGGETSVFGGAFVLGLDNMTGFVTVLDSLLGPVPPAAGSSGAGLLLTLGFTALAPGSTAVSFANLIFEDSQGGLIDALVVDGLVEVTQATAAVPEASAFALLAIGLVGILVVRKRN